MVKLPAWFNIELPDRYDEIVSWFPAEILALSFILLDVVKRYNLLEQENLVKEAKWLAGHSEVEHVFLEREEKTDDQRPI